MNPATINYLLRMLDSQYSHIVECSRRSKAAGERQRIYYSAAAMAVNAAISEAFTKPVCVLLGYDGKHSVAECPTLV